ncbi:hypothetical protein VH441_06385 [Psychrobacter sp. HD31]|uniref:hypothetical protein n=1 Tax=Psychrobacter sp. HD31 TaxID=3112003 RepID=UPI003DA31CD8
MQKNYPTAKIMLMYTFLGSYIGGMIVCFYIFIESFIQQGINEQNIDILGGLFLVGFLGILFGFMPALLTALWIVYKRYYRNTFQVYLKIFSIGFIVSLIFYILAVLLFIIISSDENGYDMAALFDLNYGKLSLIGGLSSVVVGRLCLPTRYDSNSI